MISRIGVIGGGIVGLATARALQLRFPDSRLTVFEKEHGVGLHQSGRNSGVIHSGIYYKPGSLKASNCTRGKEMLIDFCSTYQIPFQITGKVIVATQPEELPQLAVLSERGRANGVPIKLMTSEEIRQIEPHVSCLQGVQVASTGIVDYLAVCKKLVELIGASGGEVKTGFNVHAITSTGTEQIVKSAAGDTVTVDLIINCAGLASDRIARMMGIDPGLKIIPFRGEYFQLSQEKRDLCRTLIYPVPDPAFPFLGVHLTRMIDGTVECGPNAVLAFAREGYFKRDFSLTDMSDTLSYPGFRKLALRYWKTGLSEIYRSFSKSAFTRALQRLVPEIHSEDLTPAPAGIRAQAVLENGNLVDDFFIKEAQGAIHVLNAPSPAATSCLSIAEHIAALVSNR